MCVFVYVCIRVYVHVCVYMCACVCVKMYVYACVYICMCIYVCVCVCVYMCVYARVYVCVCMYISAHRLSTVMNADLIAVLDKGEVAEWGTHASLTAADGIYAHLARAAERSAKHANDSDAVAARGVVRRSD